MNELKSEFFSNDFSMDVASQCAFSQVSASFVDTACTLGVRATCHSMDLHKLM